jgi:hypothetical protein
VNTNAYRARNLIEARLCFVVDNGQKPVNYPSEAGGRHEVDTGIADERWVEIRDARKVPTRLSLDREGFMLVPMQRPDCDLYDERAVASRYTPNVEALVRALTGAKEALAFDHTRRTDDPTIRSSRGLRDPSRMVHNDYTENSATQRIRDLLPSRAAALLARRFAIVNVWRSMAGTVRRSPIALCAAASIDPKDLIATERRARDRIGETYRLAFSPTQQWFYFSNVRADEALIIKTFDSAADGRARFAPHSAFDDPGTVTTDPPRESIETRVLAFF